jgi:hypothetical protein
VITLLITPVAYSLFDDLGHRLPAWLSGCGAARHRPAASGAERGRGRAARGVGGLARFDCLAPLSMRWGGVQTNSRPRYASSLVLALALLSSAHAAQPDPSGRGRYAVGRTRITFTKTSVTTGELRPLDTVIWYPAVAGTGTAQGAVLADADVRNRHWPLVVFSHGACAFPSRRRS